MWGCGDNLTLMHPDIVPKLMNTLPLLFNKNDDSECRVVGTRGKLDNQNEEMKMEININKVKKNVLQKLRF